MQFKPILIVMAVLLVVNWIMGFILGYIPSMGNEWIDWSITAFVNAAIFLYVWKFLKAKTGA